MGSSFELLLYSAALAEFRGIPSSLRFLELLLQSPAVAAVGPFLSLTGTVAVRSTGSQNVGE